LRLEEGGSGMYFLLLVSILVLGIVLDLSYFHFQYFKITKQTLNEKKLPFTTQQWEIIFFFREREILWLGNLAGISTLLGLLGTVLGIHSAFESMKQFKQASPEIFAGGISQALLTTIYGLMIAIPSIISMHIFRNFLDSLDKRVEGIFREML
jgi:hypothetical protein